VLVDALFHNGVVVAVFVLCGAWQATQVFELASKTKSCDEPAILPGVPQTVPAAQTAADAAWAANSSAAAITNFNAIFGFIMSFLSILGGWQRSLPHCFST
jgi:hypothetical protein